MSTANKLSYLNDTKSLLRTSLNKFGSSILSTDTFRSYDTKLNDIYDKLPKVTQSGAGFTLENVQNGQVDDFKMIGVDLEQDTTNGNQLIDFSSPITDNPKITWSFENNILSIVGVSEKYLGLEFSLYNVIKNSLNAGKVIKFSSKSMTNITGTGSIVQLNIYYSDSTPTQYISLVNRNGVIMNTYTIPNDTSKITKASLVIYSNNNTTASTGSVTIEEPLVYFDNNNTYEPYTNGASPNPDYPQEIKVVEGRQVITDSGKNLLKPHAMEDTNNGITVSYDEETQVYTFNGTCTQDNTTFMLSNVNINLTANVTKSITYWIGGSCNNYCYMRHYSSGYSLRCTYSISELNENNPKIVTTSQSTFLSPASLNTIRFNNGSVANNFKIKVMVTNDDNTDYEPYYNPVSYNIDLNLENIYLAKMPNTNYKNKIYKNNGNWYFEEKVKKYILDGTENWDSESAYNENYKRFLVRNYFSETKLNNNGMNNYFFQRVSESHGDYQYLYLQPSSSNIHIQIYSNIVNSLSNFKDWLSTHNVIGWHILDNSTTTQITNTTLINQLEALYLHTGTNIITISNDNNIIPEIEITRLKELEKLS